MKHFFRFVLLFVALAFGGVLGHFLLNEFDPVKIIVFTLSCSVFGEVFYQIDKRISK